GVPTAVDCAAVGRVAGPPVVADLPTTIGRAAAGRAAAGRAAAIGLPATIGRATDIGRAAAGRVAGPPTVAVGLPAAVTGRAAAPSGRAAVIGRTAVGLPTVWDVDDGDDGTVVGVAAVLVEDAPVDGVVAAGGPDELGRGGAAGRGGAGRQAVGGQGEAVAEA